MVNLKNNIMSVDIDTHGAEIKRITVNGEDRQWSGDPDVWEGTAPVLFPMCGGLRDDKFTHGGKEYHLAKHGFAKKMDFEVESKTETAAVLLLKSNAETLKQFPWEFEFRVRFALDSGKITVIYDVKNLSDDTMYMSVGAHEAYACPEGIEQYDVIFEREETLNAWNLNGNLLDGTVTPVLKESRVLPLYEKYFAVDALVFKDVKSNFVTLRNRVTGKSVSLDFTGFDYFLLWQKPGAKYICLEPWSGATPLENSSYELKEKEGITAVEPGKNYAFTHKIYF